TQDLVLCDPFAATPWFAHQKKSHRQIHQHQPVTNRKAREHSVAQPARPPKHAGMNHYTIQRLIYSWVTICKTAKSHYPYPFACSQSRVRNINFDTASK